MAIKVTKSQEDKRIDALQGKGSSGGVGENVGQHNERFNGYETADGNTITGGDYNHAESYKNTLQGCYKTHITGGENTAQGVTGGIIGGESNTVLGSTHCIVGGYGNTLTPKSGGSYGGGILVAMTSIVRGFFNAIFGHNHGVTGDTNIVGGVHNTISGDNNDCSGTGNTVTGHSNIVGGVGNTVSGTGAIVSGTSHNVTQGYCLVVGDMADTSTVSNVKILVGGGSWGNSFYVQNNGYCYAAGGYNTTGADYAEYFEWADKNAMNEDRCGMLVSLYGDKIELAHGDDFFGVVSANPSLVGNSHYAYWHGRYETDVFGRILNDECGKPIVSDEYDKKMKYIPRSDRPEWDAIGLIGRLVIIDDGSCKVGGYVSARHGIGTACFAKTAARVLKRIDDKHVEVLIK